SRTPVRRSSCSARSERTRSEPARSSSHTTTFESMSKDPVPLRRTRMELQDVVQRRIDELVETELGLQVAVYRRGELVVDAVAGDGVTPETLYFAASTGKGASATVANVLVDRGVLEYDRPIVDVW